MSLEKLECGVNYTVESIRESINGLIDISNGESTDKVKSVAPVDFFPIDCYDNHSGFMYGKSSLNTNQIVKVDLLTKQESNYGVPLPEANVSCLKVLDGTTMIVQTDTGTGIFSYYKTTDSGISWRKVLTQDIELVRMLTNRSMCVADISGVTTLFFGEYNVNTNRIDGLTNDRVRLLRSTDLGDSWDTVTEWNSDGINNNIRHIHAVKQNPENKMIYVITGDSDYQSSIYAWDGVSPWDSNLNPADTVQSEGLKNVTGRQAFRTVDLLFQQGKIYTMPDAPTSGFSNDTECGIWSISNNLDLSTLKRLSTVSTHMTGVAGWLADVLPDGRQVWIAGNEIIKGKEKYNCLIMSNKELTEWKTVGAYRCTDDSNFIVPLNLFVHDNTIYVSCLTGSGKSNSTTISATTTDNDFKGDYETLYTPDTIHPVYWIDSTNGSDSNDGWTPRAPFKSINHALKSGRVTFGGRLQILGSRLEVEDVISPSVQGNPREGDPLDFVTVQGDGATKTELVMANSATSTVLMEFAENVAQKIEFRDLWVKTEKSSVNGIETYDAPLSGEHEFRSVRVIWGEYIQRPNRFNRLIRSYKCKTSIYGSIFELPPQSFSGALDAKSKGFSDYYVEDSLFFMGNHHATLQGPDNSFRFYKCDFTGAWESTIEIKADTSFLSKSMLKCNFWTAGVKESKAISDLSGLVWNEEFKCCNGNQDRGVQSAFDGYSVQYNSVVPNFDYSRYVY